MDRMGMDRDALELEEKHVADAIEEAIPQASSIEEELMLEAAEMEELRFGPGGQPHGDVAG